MKPLEFSIKKINKLGVLYETTYYYYDEKGKLTKTFKTYASTMPDGLELNKHYSIADIYGYKVVDDREGL